MATVVRAPLVTRIAQSPHVRAAIESEDHVWTNRLLNLLARPFTLTDWPNPRGAVPAVDGRSWAQNLQQSTFSLPRGKPNALTDWPNPQGAQGSIELRSWLKNLNNTLLTVPSPFYSTDWPNPRGPSGTVDLRTYFQGFSLTLRGLDTFFYGPGRGPAYDWPNPRGAQGLTPTWGWWFNAAPAITTRFRTPLSIRIERPFTTVPLDSEGSVWSNRLLDLYATAQTPLSQDDWPNPMVPQGGVELRTFLGTVALNLLGQDILFGGVGQPLPNLDWPNPSGPAYPVDLRSWGHFSLASLVAPVPITTFDWPNPYGPVGALDLRTWVSGPFVPYFPDIPAPFIPPDLINPQGYLASTYLRQMLGGGGGGLDHFFGEPGQPVSNLDWPNPMVAAYSVYLRGWGYNLLQNTLGPTIQNPFVLLDWPNPRELGYPIELRSYLKPMQVQLIGQDLIYTVPGQVPTYDWPNPSGPAYPVDLRSWAGALVDYTLALPAGTPFYLTDWPNPRGIVIPIEWRTWLENLIQQTLSLPSQTPFYLTEWPNPVGTAYPLELRSFLYQLTQLLPPPVVSAGETWYRISRHYGRR